MLFPRLIPAQLTGTRDAHPTLGIDDRTPELLYKNTIAMMYRHSLDKSTRYEVKDNMTKQVTLIGAKVVQELMECREVVSTTSSKLQ